MRRRTRAIVHVFVLCGRGMRVEHGPGPDGGSIGRRWCETSRCDPKTSQDTIPRKRTVTWRIPQSSSEGARSRQEARGRDRAGGGRSGFRSSSRGIDAPTCLRPIQNLVESQRSRNVNFYYLPPMFTDKPGKNTLSIRLAESAVFLRTNDFTGRSRDSRPALLRGLLVLDLVKPTKISSIELELTAKTSTSWPEG